MNHKSKSDVKLFQSIWKGWDCSHLIRWWLGRHCRGKNYWESVILLFHSRTSSSKKNISFHPKVVRTALSYISCVEVRDSHGYFSLRACLSLALWLSSSLAVKNSGSQVSNHKVLSWPHNFETTDSTSLDIWNRWLTLQKFNINAGGSNASLVNHTSKLSKGTLCTFHSNICLESCAYIVYPFFSLIWLWLMVIRT